MMYGQMTAGSWIYIGSQGIIQGTFETFSAAGEKHLGGELQGKLIVSGGMGGMSGAQPLAATMTGACYLGIEVDLNVSINACAPAIATLWRLRSTRHFVFSRKRCRRRRASRSGWWATAATSFLNSPNAAWCRTFYRSRTSAHDPLNGYVPRDMSLEAALELRTRDPKK